jgi:integrase
VVQKIGLVTVKGPGALTKPERKRRASEIIIASGADTEELFNRVQAVNLGITFERQAELWLSYMETRRRKPCKPATLQNWQSTLRRWVLPRLGSLPLSVVNNARVKPLIDEMSAAGRGAKAITTAFQVIRAVVSFPKDESTRKPLYVVNWDKDYLDIPMITYSRQPAFTSEEVTKIINEAIGQFQMLYALLAGTGLRVGEIFGLEINKHIAPDCSTIMVEQSVFNGKVQAPKTDSAKREIDLHPQLAQTLKRLIGSRASGFLFRSTSGTPLSGTNILRRHFHPILKKIGWNDPKTNDKKTGFHAFRRFRVTWLRKQRAPEDLLRFWIGHGSNSITSGYSMIKADLAFRKGEAERLGLGFELPIKLGIPGDGDRRFRAIVITIPG